PRVLHELRVAQGPRARRRAARRRRVPVGPARPAAARRGSGAALARPLERRVLAEPPVAEPARGDHERAERAGRLARDADRTTARACRSPWHAGAARARRARGDRSEAAAAAAMGRFPALGGGRRILGRGRASPPRPCALPAHARRAGRRRLQRRPLATRAPAAVTAGATRLAVRGLCIAAARRTLVLDLAFEAHGGEFIAILGRNGVGKTLTLHTLAGLR